MLGARARVLLLLLSLPLIFTRPCCIEDCVGEKVNFLWDLKERTPEYDRLIRRPKNREHWTYPRIIDILSENFGLWGTCHDDYQYGGVPCICTPNHEAFYKPFYYDHNNNKKDGLGLKNAMKVYFTKDESNNDHTLWPWYYFKSPQEAAEAKRIESRKRAMSNNKSAKPAAKRLRLDSNLSEEELRKFLRGTK